MRAEIITIGDELLIGQVVDTNSAFMAQQLNTLGIELYQVTSVHDDRAHIISSLNDAFRRANIIFTTGGLGPTKDDITKHVLAEYFGTTLVENPRVREHINNLYSARPEVLNRLTATQWLVPACATILENRVGSAPIMVFRRGNQLLISLPGVPYEMEIAMTEQVIPYLKRLIPSLGAIEHRTLMVCGIPESSLAIMLENYENSLPTGIHMAYLPKDGMIRLRLSAYGAEAAAQVDVCFDQLQFLVHDYLVTTDDRPLELHLADALNKRHATIATAESCTGGKLASLLNRHPGSSSFYTGSVIAYDNRIKQQVLGVSAHDLQHCGAVSEEIVCQMATGIRHILRTDYAIATSGIAGPDGGTPEKPVGTVWIAWATPEGTTAECFHLGKLREQVTDRACQRALMGMLKRMKNEWI